MIKTIEEVTEALVTLGYDAVQAGDTAFVKVGGFQKPFTSVIEIMNDELTVSCEIATLAEIGEENLPAVTVSALNANTMISPFAFAIISGDDDDAIQSVEDYLLVLIDSAPLSDFSSEELAFTMQKLINALHASKDVLGIYQQEEELV